VLERVPGLRRSVSVTTRPPRLPTERDGDDYHFVSEGEFTRMVGGSELLEWAEVFGSRYGTPRARVERWLAAGHDVVLEIDVQGARQVKDRLPEAVLIFLEPPSMPELERRLRSRGTEDELRIADRLAKADWELAQRGWFDHVVVNADVEQAAAEVAAIIHTPPSSRIDVTEGPTHR
jgi:guanylate kinase